MATYSIETVKAKLEEAEERLVCLEKMNAVLKSKEYSNEEKIKSLTDLGLSMKWAEFHTEGSQTIRTLGVKNRIKRYKKRLAMC